MPPTAAPADTPRLSLAGPDSPDSLVAFAPATEVESRSPRLVVDGVKARGEPTPCWVDERVEVGVLASGVPAWGNSVLVVVTAWDPESLFVDPVVTDWTAAAVTGCSDKVLEVVDPDETVRH